MNVTGVQTCALPIYLLGRERRAALAQALVGEEYVRWIAHAVDVVFRDAGVHAIRAHPIRSHSIRAHPVRAHAIRSHAIGAHAVATHAVAAHAVAAHANRVRADRIHVVLDRSVQRLTELAIGLDAARRATRQQRVSLQKTAPAAAVRVFTEVEVPIALRYVGPRKIERNTVRILISGAAIT